MPLTDTAIRTVKPGAKIFKVYDGGGLYLEVTPAGGKRWRWKYHYGRKEKRLSFGIYPDVKLKSARKKRDTGRPSAPTGSIWWRFKYRFVGKEKLLSLDNNDVKIHP